MSQRKHNTLYAVCVDHQSVMVTASGPRYLNAEKIGIRAAFAAASRGETMVYLDCATNDFNDSATSYFRSIGYAAEKLIPVNDKDHVCNLLCQSGLQCTPAKFLDVVKKCENMGVGGIWADFMGPHSYSNEEIQESLRAARFVFTLSYNTKRNSECFKYDNKCTISLQLATNKRMEIEELGKGMWKCTNMQVYGSANDNRSLDMVNLQFQRVCFMNESLFVLDIEKPNELLADDCAVKWKPPYYKSPIVSGSNVTLLKDEKRYGSIRWKVKTVHSNPYKASKTDTFYILMTLTQRPVFLTFAHFVTRMAIAGGLSGERQAGTKKAVSTLKKSI